VDLNLKQVKIFYFFFLISSNSHLIEITEQGLYEKSGVFFLVCVCEREFC
jgi:hypothetical protein